MSFVQRIVVRSGLAIDVPTLDIAEVGYDRDTKTGRFGDGTSTPPRVMTDKSTGIFDFSATTSVKFKQIDMVSGGKVDGVDVSNLISGNGLLVHTGNGSFVNRSITNIDSYINVVNGSGVGGNIQLSLSDAFIAAFNALQTQVANIGINTVTYYTVNQSLPTTNIGPIWSDLYNTIMTWQSFTANGANFTGYASHNLGRKDSIYVSSPPQGWLKRNGAFLSKTTYAALWNWALHSGIVVPIVSWAAGTNNFADNGDGTFRIPDNRGEYERLWDDGRGIDSGRGLGTWQDSQNKAHTHGVNDYGHNHGLTAPGNIVTDVLGSYKPGSAWDNDMDYGMTQANIAGAYTGISIQSSGGTETRVRNTSYNGVLKF